MPSQLFAYIYSIHTYTITSMASIGRTTELHIVDATFSENVPINCQRHIFCFFFLLLLRSFSRQSSSVALTLFEGYKFIIARRERAFNVAYEATRLAITVILSHVGILGAHQELSFYSNMALYIIWSIGFVLSRARERHCIAWKLIKNNKSWPTREREHDASETAH